MAEALRRTLTKVAAARHLSRPPTLNSSGATLSHAKNEPTGRPPTRSLRARTPRTNERQRKIDEVARRLKQREEEERA